MNTYVCLDSWAGRTQHRVTVLKVCAKRSKVRFEEQAFGRPVGHVQYVPNHAIKQMTQAMLIVSGPELEPMEP